MSEFEKPDFHPDEETARAYVARTLPEEQTEQFEQHYFSCERCWFRVRQALELREALAAGASVGIRTSRPLAGWTALAAAAAVMLAVSVGIWNLSSRGPAMRGPGTEFVPTVSLVEGGVRVVWRAVDAAGVYRVEVFTHDGALLLAEETPELQMVIREDELLSTEHPGSLVLKVQALDRLRAPLAASPLVKLPGEVGAESRRQ